MIILPTKHLCMILYNFGRNDTLKCVKQQLYNIDIFLMNRVHVDVLRCAFRDVETILNLRETCQFFAFHVFPKEWLDVQKCSVIRRISSLLPKKEGVMTVRKWIKLTFRGLKEDQSALVFSVFQQNRILARHVIQSWLRNDSFFLRITNDCMIVGKKMSCNSTYHINAKGQVHGSFEPTTLYDLIQEWKFRFPRMCEATII